MSSSLLLALLVNRSPTERLIQNILHNPFAGIHELAWFDWSILIPYFTVLIILSIYGLHRYDIIRTYFKHKKKKTTEPAKRFPQLPRVTIQLPLYNERYVVELLIEETVKMDFPKDLLQIQVLDDSTDDTAPFAGALVERYRTLGYPIEYHHRTNRHGFKAGALQHGARSCAGYFFNFNGTAGILRVAMISDAGGWQHDTLTEDSDLSYRAQLKGWRFMYVPGLDCPSELPVE